MICSTQRVIASLFLFTFSIGIVAKESAYTFVKNEYKFVPHSVPMTQVDTALEKAKLSGKPLILVLGAEWCHDSRGLAGKFSTPEMSTLIESSFETVFIDVGYLQDRRDITQRFGYPIYFATPTVLVIDPATEKHVNKTSMAKWASADSVDLQDYLSYFSDFTALDTQISRNKMLPPKLQDFAYAQAQRLQNAYAELGPQLELDDQGKPPEGFYDFWKEVRSYRMQVMSDLGELQKQADNGNPIASDQLPVYGPFTWEVE